MTLASAFQAAAGRVPAADPAGAPAVVGEPPRLSVALASRNRKESLGRALDALAHQTYPPERFEVVVVLDGSTDGSAEFVGAKELPFPLKVVQQDHQGLSATRNRGVAEAAHEVIVFLDDDIMLDERCLELYADAHRHRGPDHVVLGSAWPEVGTDVWSAMVRDWWIHHYETKAEPGHRWTFIDVGDGMACLTRRLHLEIGGFDEAFRERRQDWEWGIRLFRRGARFTQLLDARGRHLVDTGIPTGLRYSRQEGRSDVQLGRKHPEVRGRLFLGGFARRADSFARRAHFAYAHPAASRPVAASLTALAFALNWAGNRRQLGRVARRLRTYAYLMGVRDALGPETDALDEFLEPVARGDGAETLVVDLDRPAPLEVPPVGGALDLSMLGHGRELARVVALEPGQQWDWDELTDRVVSAIDGLDYSH